MHHNQTHRNTAWRLAAALFLMALLSVACGDDFGTECTLPDNEFVDQACGASDENTTQSCVVENIIQCDSRLCGVYRGSNAFCTKRCDGKNDTSCPSGAFCSEFVVGTGEFFCVKAEFEGR